MRRVLNRFRPRPRLTGWWVTLEGGCCDVLEDGGGGPPLVEVYLYRDLYNPVYRGVAPGGALELARCVWEEGSAGDPLVDYLLERGEPGLVEALSLVMTPDEGRA